VKNRNMKNRKMIRKCNKMTAAYIQLHGIIFRIIQFLMQLSMLWVPSGVVLSGLGIILHWKMCWKKLQELNLKMILELKLISYYRLPAPKLK
jgi:hypothetical protein